MAEKKIIQLHIEDKSSKQTVDFILDSNTIRFKSGASENEEAIQAVQSFFEYTDSCGDTYNFVVPWQVGSELRIYVYRMRTMFPDNEDLQEQANVVERYIKDLEFVDCEADKLLEEDIRMFFDYVKSKYDFYYEDGKKLKLNSLKSDDAKIFLTAIKEDKSIVTDNSRDFAPIVAFDKAFWNPVEDNIYRVSPEAQKIFEEDSHLQSWIQDILKKFNSEVSQEEEKLLLDSLKENKVE